MRSLGVGNFEKKIGREKSDYFRKEGVTLWERKGEACRNKSEQLGLQAKDYP